MRYLLLIITVCLCILPIHAQITCNCRLMASDLSVTQQEGFDIVRVKGTENLTQEIGAPELPMFVKTFVVPLDAKVTGVDVSLVDRKEIEGDYLPYPVQSSIPTNGNVDTTFTNPNPIVYDAGALYPDKRAEILADYENMGISLGFAQFGETDYHGWRCCRGRWSEDPERRHLREERWSTAAFE